MSRVADLYARISPKLAGKPGSTQATRAHAWIFRRSKGRIGKRFLGAPVLVLRTTGRKSGRPRESPMFFVPHDGGYAVVASNAASKRPPAWWLNLQARPEAEVLLAGDWHAVRARRAGEDEEEALWPRLLAIYRGYEHYRTIATRETPVVLLEPRSS